MRAMIFAAGRGERMRPLTDTRPKPLLEAGGRSLLAAMIDGLVRGGWTDIVINHAWLGEQIEATIGDGARFGARIAYSREGSARETAGGIAMARPLLGEGVFLAVSGDIHTDFDFATLHAPARAMVEADAPRMHLVMVPNPDFHRDGDFVLRDDGRLVPDDGAPRLTFANIGLYDMRSFATITPGASVKLGPLMREAIAAGRASGERYDGRWRNIGTPAQLAALDAELQISRSPV